VSGAGTTVEASMLHELNAYTVGSGFVSNTHDRFLQLGCTLGWKADTSVLMLWAYFDESGWHAPNGSLRKLTLGGCIASFESWERLSQRWSSALKMMNLPCFHMAHFEARKSPYSDWTDDERKSRLNTFLEILGEPERYCFGFTNLARPDDTTSSIYKRCAHDLLLELAMFDDEFAVVFARHPEFARQNELLGLLQEYGMGEKIRSCTVAKPIDLCPLQAADVIAYEVSRFEREVLIPRRYPLRRIQELGATFRFVSAVE
jgi:hypothetical protein